MHRRRLLVGRDSQVEAVLDIVRSSTSGTASFVGAAGVGKTALAAACIAALEDVGHEAIRCSATRSAATFQLGAVAPLLAPTDGAGLAALLQRSVKGLAERHRTGPIVVFVDDAHLLDPASAALVHQLALARACPLLLTVRSGETAPDSIESIWRDGLGERIDVAPLDEPSSDELLRRLLDGEPHSELARTVWTVCAGNPLFTREVLQAAQTVGALEVREGLWCQCRPLPSPASLAEAVTDNIDAVGHPDLLDALALLERIGYDVLAAIFGAANLDRCEEAGLVTVVEDGDRSDVVFAHPLMAQAVLDRLTTGRRRRAREHVLDLLAASPARRTGDAERLAVASIQIDRPLARAVLERAKDEARHRGDAEMGELFARHLATSGDVGDVFTWAESLHTLGRHHDVEAALAPIPLDEDNATDIAWLRAHNLAFGLGQVDDALRCVEASRLAAPDQNYTFDVIESIAHLSAGATSRSAELARRVIDAPNSTHGARAQAWWVCALQTAFAGAVDRTMEAGDHEAQETAAAFHATGTPMTDEWARSLFWRAFVLAESGDLDTAEAHARRGLEAGIDVRSAETRSTFRHALGRIALLRGAWSDAAIMFRHGSVDAGLVSDRMAMRWHLSGLALALAELGDLDGAVDALQRRDGIDIGAFGLLETDLVTRATARVAALDGDLELAAKVLQTAANRCRDDGAHAIEAALLHDLARLDPADLHPRRLRWIAQQVDGPLVGLRQAHAAALTAGDAPALERVSAEFQRLGYLGFARAAGDVAIRWLREQGRTNAAERLVASMGRGGDSPATVDAASAIDLTSRERQIAVLAASGLSSKEIAERLVVSVRTVDNHLQRVYVKLGIRRRQDLVACLLPVPA